MLENLKECFSNALKDEKKGKKHKRPSGSKARRKRGRRIYNKSKKGFGVVQIV